MSTIVFDIGGTWFRSGVITEGQLTLSETIPAASRRRLQSSGERELHEILVTYLIDRAMTLRDANGLDTDIVVVSLGAAINIRSGTVLEAAPLWGPSRYPLQLESILDARCPTFRWKVINDITAAAYFYARDPRLTPVRRFAIITVSTGIGARTYDHRTPGVPVSEFGLQGEIGHTPVYFAVRGRRIHRRCDCGGLNHLGAFASGSALPEMLERLQVAWPQSFNRLLLGPARAGRGPEQLWSNLGRGAESGQPFARRLVRKISKPLADQIVCLLTCDSEIGRVMIVGGVIRGIGPAYLRGIHENLASTGLYQIAIQDVAFWRTVVLADFEDHAGNAGLVGAGAFADALH